MRDGLSSEDQPGQNTYSDIIETLDVSDEDLIAAILAEPDNEFIAQF